MDEEFPVTKKHSFWKDISDKDWNNWHWQQSNRVTKIEKLKEIAGKDLTKEEIEAFEKTSSDFMMGITPYYLSLINFKDKNNPIRLQAIPQPGEIYVYLDQTEDPLAEERDMPVPGLTHRYPDRVLLYTTHNCPVYCRHCTRKRKVSDPLSAASTTQIESALVYIREHAEIRDIVVSGGDPLSLSDDRLFKLISDIQDIPHMQMLRLGTRNLVTLPQRITKDFTEKIKELNSRAFENGIRKPVFVNTHFNHPDECTEEAAEACYRLSISGSPLGNQTVLLKGINDNPEIMKELFQRLLQMSVKPYYVYLCDPVTGTAHFRTPVEKGLEIIDNLRGHTSGFATPQLVIDAPGGGGKILIPNGIIARHVEEKYTIWKLMNFEKNYFYYIAPTDTTDYYERYSKPIPQDFDISELENSPLKFTIEKNLPHLKI